MINHKISQCATPIVVLIVSLIVWTMRICTADEPDLLVDGKSQMHGMMVSDIWSEADTVVVGTFNSCRIVERQFPESRHVFDEVRRVLVPVLSEFSVTSVLKGRVPENIEVAHYLFRSKPDNVDKFVNLVDFRKGKQSVAFDVGVVARFPVVYVLLLNRLDDGTLEPATGQINVAESVFYLVPSLPNSGQAASSQSCLENRPNPRDSAAEEGP